MVTVSPSVVLIDARDGTAMQQHTDDTLGRARWVRFGETGQMVIGYDQGIRAIDIRRARAAWTARGDTVRFSHDPWLFDDSLFLLTQSRDMILLSVREGAVRTQPLDTWQDHLANARRMELFGVGPNRVAVSTHQGLLLYDRKGELAGADALAGFDSLLPPEPADGMMVTVETIASGRRADGQMIFLVHQLDTKSAMLMASTPIVLGATPDRITVLDGTIAISAGVATVFLDAPAR